METVLPLIDLAEVDNPSSAAALVSECRCSLFSTSKLRTWTGAINSTQSKESVPELRLSRPHAAAHAALGEVDTDARHTLFAQAYRGLHRLPATLYRRHGQVYKTILMGEKAEDAGGPYRETFAAYAAELQVCVAATGC